MQLKAIAIFLCSLLLAQPALAFEKFFAKYCAERKIPVELAIAVAKHESGMKPLCINVEGKDYLPASREEAEKIIRKSQKEDKSYDVGLMQINSQWVKRWKIDPVSLLEPETNIRLGVRLLAEEIERHGLNWRAIGKYHSPNPLRGMQYAGMVTRHLRGNPELKSKLANPRLVNPRIVNPRLAAAFMARHHRFRAFRSSYLMDSSVLPQANLQRAPMEWKHTADNEKPARRFRRLRQR